MNKPRAVAKYVLQGTIILLVTVSPIGKRRTLFGREWGNLDASWW